jgi:hypothetical protein
MALTLPLSWLRWVPIFVVADGGTVVTIAGRPEIPKFV